jgi:hypothetical protein
MMKKITLFLSLLISLGLSAQALDPEKAFIGEVSKMDNLQQLLKMAGETGKNEQYARQEVVLKRLVALRPYNPDLKFALIKAYALQDKKTEAYNDLLELQKAGLSYPIGNLEGFDNIKETKVFDYIEDGMLSNAKPFGEGSQVFAVSDDYSGMLFENMVYDPNAERFLLGSVRAGVIYEYSEKNGFKEFINPSNPATGPWGIIDIAIDTEADLLWTASATMPHYTGTTQANFGNAMVSKFKLSTGELINNFAMAKSTEPMLFSHLHVTAGQNLYFTNVFNSDVFKVAKDSEQVEPMFTLTGLNSIKAITTNTDETILYVSDFELGLFVVNLETKQTAPLMRDQSGFFAGINDLFYDEGDLVAIQSGVQPARLMRYVLQQDLILKNMFPIEASHPSFKALGNGTLVGDSVYYAANSQWAKLDGIGRLLPEQSWDPLVIMKSPTKYRMEEHMEQQRKMEEIKRKRGLK